MAEKNLEYLIKKITNEHEDKLKLDFSKSKINIKGFGFYITITNINKKIEILKYWKFGVLGKFFFMKRYVLMNTLEENIKTQLIKNGYQITKLHLNIC